MMMFKHEWPFVWCSRVLHSPEVARFYYSPLFFFFAFARLTVSSGHYHCSEHNVHGWTNDVLLPEKGMIG